MRWALALLTYELGSTRDTRVGTSGFAVGKGVRDVGAQGLQQHLQAAAWKEQWLSCCRPTNETVDTCMLMIIL